MPTTLPVSQSNEHPEGSPKKRIRGDKIWAMRCIQPNSSSTRCNTIKAVTMSTIVTISVSDEASHCVKSIPHDDTSAAPMLRKLKVASLCGISQLSTMADTNDIPIRKATIPPKCEPVLCATEHSTGKLCETRHITAKMVASRNVSVSVVITAMVGYSGRNMLVRNTMAESPESPMYENTGVSHPANQSMTPTYCSTLTAKEMGNITLNSQRQMLIERGMARSTHL